MRNLFNGCTNLTSLNLSSFDTSNVKYISYMFNRCTGLTSLNLSSFDISNVEEMDSMFYYCKNLTNLDIRNFDFSNVNVDDTYYSFMFTDINSNITIHVKDNTAKEWIVSNFSNLNNNNIVIL